MYLTLRNITFGPFWSVYQTLIQSHIEAKQILLAPVDNVGPTEGVPERNMEKQKILCLVQN